MGKFTDDLLQGEKVKTKKKVLIVTEMMYRTDL